MDLTQSIEARSDQLNADDLHTPATYTIREVVKGKAEQPFDFMLVETERAYRPSKTMRRMIVAAWGSDANAYPGRRLTLYREPSIRFGKDIVGGIRISHMSHIAKRVEEKFQTTRGKRETFTVDPLPAVTKQEQPPAAVIHDETGEIRTAQQSTALHAAFGAAGMDRDTALAYCVNVIQRGIDSTKELTKREASDVLNALHEDAQVYPPDTQEPTDD